MSVLALIKAVVQLLGLVMGRANAERERGLGRTEAIVASLEQTVVAIRTAREVEAQAEATHRADPTDGAFDLEFMRKD
ncbi:hypothetical protein [Methylobacterium iners]|uniref:Uncharacterized protein n=1 Tax=Methylobacterium iners TaxID=418707 RepID=A0ABQ4S3M7_9HYPH|nr:hypothetical protein [Methylobacterium iners]GJD97733.1 hypothetical protein OCOJLMKI_4966 [Methylobacterium iners]